MIHICVIKLAIVGSGNGFSPGLNQCWNIINWTPGNKLQWNFNQNTKLFIHENASENIVCEMVTILCGGRLVNVSNSTMLYSKHCIDVISWSKMISLQPFFCLFWNPDIHTWTHLPEAKITDISKTFVFSWINFLAATKQLYKWYFPSVRLSVTPFRLCSHHRIIMKFSGVITTDQSKVHAKGQGQRSRTQRSQPNLTVSGL